MTKQRTFNLHVYILDFRFYVDIVSHDRNRNCSIYRQPTDLVDRHYCLHLGLQLSDEGIMEKTASRSTIFTLDLILTLSWFIRYS